MSAPSHRPAEALADRLDRIAPVSLSIRARDGEIAVHAGTSVLGIGTDLAGITGARDGERFAEDAATASRAALDAVQDVVVRHRAAPWPVDADGEMASPGSRAEGRTLHLWFGRDEAGAVFTLRPIDLGALTTR